MAAFAPVYIVDGARSPFLKSRNVPGPFSASDLAILKSGDARALRFTTLEALCRELSCQPGDLLTYAPDGPTPDAPA